MLMKTKFEWENKGNKTVIKIMYINIQCISVGQKANFDHFNELKILILSSIPRILKIYLVKKEGGGGASIRINTVVCIVIHTS